MDTDRLSRFGSTMKERASITWQATAIHFARGLQWLKDRPQAVFLAAGIALTVLLFDFSGATAAVAAAAAWVALMRHFAQTDLDRQRQIDERVLEGYGKLCKGPRATWE
jgi:hypothetical protein